VVQPFASLAAHLPQHQKGCGRAAGGESRL